MANSQVTPTHIVPEWYFLPFYAILRAIDFNVLFIDSRLGGVIAFGGSILILFFLPWLDRSPVRSGTFRPLFQPFYWLFVVNFIAADLSRLGAGRGHLRAARQDLHGLLLRSTSSSSCRCSRASRRRGRCRFPSRKPCSPSRIDPGAPMIRITTIAAALVLGFRPRRARRGAGGGGEPREPRDREADLELSRASSAPSTCNQLQRGFQVFQDVCANCHGARLLAFRNLSERGGPEFSEEQVKALAATYRSPIPTAEGGARPGVPADRWPTLADRARMRSRAFGVVPPDFSVIAKARGITAAVPVVDRQLLHGLCRKAVRTTSTPCCSATAIRRRKAPRYPRASTTTRSFPGHAIGMPPPLSDGVVTYEDETFPQTTDQYAQRRFGLPDVGRRAAPRRAQGNRLPGHRSS